MSSSSLIQPLRLIFMRTLRDLSSHPLAAVDSLLTANEYASVVAPLQVLRFAKPPEGEEGGAFSLVPREKEMGEREREREIYI